MLSTETVILGRIVRIRALPFGQYEASMQGRGGFEIDPRTARDLSQAKMEAHAFVHRTLKRICECPEICWVSTTDVSAPPRAVDSCTKDSRAFSSSMAS